MAIISDVFCSSLSEAIV